MRGGKREGAGRKRGVDSYTEMYYLRVSLSLRNKLRILTPDEAREVLEIAADKKIIAQSKINV